MPHAAEPTENFEAKRGDQRATRQRSLALAGVCVITAVAHWPALDSRTMCIDDVYYIHGNRAVQNPSWANAGRFLAEVLNPTTVPGYYQPLAMISLMLDSALGGSPQNLAPYHRTSLLLHVLNVVLLALILEKLSGNGPAAAIAALLYGVHPLTADSVVWLAERKTVLATFFALLGMLLYMHYVRIRGTTGSKLHSGTRNWAYGAALGAFCLGLLAKPTIVALPVILLVLDWWPLRRFSARAVLEKTPFFVLAAIAAVITYVSQKNSAGLRTPEAAGAHIGVGLIPMQFAMYAERVFWPAAGRLSAFYPLPRELGFSAGQIWAATAGFLAVVGACIVLARRNPAMPACLLMFMVAILPTLGIVQFTTSFIANRFVYFPLCALALLLAAGLLRLLSIARGARAGVIAMTLFLAVIEIGNTHTYLETWRETEPHYRAMLTVTPNSSVVEFSLGRAFDLSGRKAEARVQYERALAIDPNYVAALNNLGNLALDEGRADDAVGHFRRLSAMQPESAFFTGRLAAALGRAGQHEESLRLFREALARGTPGFYTLYDYGNELVRLNRFAESIEPFRECVRLNPDDAAAQNNLALSLQITQQPQAALPYARTAAMLDPENAQIRFNLGVLLLTLEKPAEALAHLHAAARLSPRNVRCFQALGDCLALLGRFEEAGRIYEAGLQVEPDNAEMREALESVRAQR